MALKYVKPADYSFEHPGFSAFSGEPDIQQRHRHNEIEMAVFGGRPIVVLYGGRQMTIEPDRLVVFWGTMSHQALQVAKATTGLGIRIPLTWVLQWNLPEAFIHRLMNFEVLYDAPHSVPCSDLTLIQHWVDLMKDRQPEGCRIVALEAEARLRRLAMTTSEIKKVSSFSNQLAIPTGLGRLERMLEHIARHYRTPLCITEIARTARLSRNQAMRSFRQLTGMSILEYITQHRVSHAQRLLITTDMKIVDIVYESGFSSPTRCYAAFHKYIGQSPAFYRRAMSQSHPTKRQV